MFDESQCSFHCAPHPQIISKDMLSHLCWPCVMDSWSHITLPTFHMIKIFIYFTWYLPWHKRYGIISIQIFNGFLLVELICADGKLFWNPNYGSLLCWPINCGFQSIIQSLFFTEGGFRDFYRFEFLFPSIWSQGESQSSNVQSG